MIGASGHGKVCAEVAELSGRFDEIVFLDDNISLKKCGSYDVVGVSNDCWKYVDRETEFFVSIGNNEYRRFF